MSDIKVAKLFRNGGRQAVRLPAEFQFEGAEVYVRRNDATGDVTLSRHPGSEYWKAYFDYLDSLDIPQEDLDASGERMEQIVADRQKHPISRRGVSDDLIDDTDSPERRTPSSG